MTGRGAGLVLAAILPLAAGCVLGRIARTPAEEGREIYLDMCASCHGEDARGGGPAASALRTRPPDLTRIAARRGLYASRFVIDVITGKEAIAAHGSREMPVWGERFAEREPSMATAVASIFFRRRLEILADYLEDIQEPRAETDR